MKVLKRIRSLYDFIGGPHSGVVDEDDRARAALISFLLFLYLILTLASWTGVTLALKPEVSAGLQIVFLTAVPAFTALYLLSRTVYFNLAAHFFVCLNIALIFFPAIRGPREELAQGLYHLTNTVIICSLILPVRSVIIISGLCFAGVMALPALVPHISVAFTAVIARFFGFSIILIVVIMMIREWRLRQARAAEKQARDAEHRFRILADHASEGVAMLQGEVSLATLRLHDHNAAFSAIFSPFCPNFANRTLDLIFPGETQAAVLEAVRNNGGCEITVNPPGLPAKILFVSCKPSREDKSGSKILIVSDVTAAREAVALRAQKLAAEAANQAKSLFLASVSHEIRTPLTAILGFSELLQDDASPEKVRIYVERILQNGVHLSQLINNVIDLSRIEAGQLLIDSAEFSPAQEISWSLDQLRWKAEKRNITLELQSRHLPKEVCSDAVKFRQIIFNLLDNAIKFSPPKSTIVVTASAASRPGREGEVRITVDVSDQGPGISPEMRERIFNYFELEHDTGTNPHGSGIGLALSRRLAQALGGDLALISAKSGEGSTFRFTIHCSTFDSAGFPEETDAPEATQPDADLHGYKILIVDDNTDNQILSQTILRSAGAETEIAADGQTAVDKGSEEAYDLILMDIRMPGMTGDIAARTLRKNGYKGPIVALTADAIRTGIDPGTFHDFDGFLVKPVNAQRLLNELQKHLSG